MLVFDIYVQANISLIDNQIKVLFPKENIQLSQAQGSIVISGSVTNPELSKQVQAIIEAAGFKDKVVNMLRTPVADALQVQMQIRVAEVNRQVLREVGAAYRVLNPSFGFDINPSGPPAAGSPLSSTLALFLGNSQSRAITDTFITALHSRGALRALAEPNLIAMNGKKASFLAGGEFPIPIIQSISTGQSAITIQWKEFGVKLGFTPTIIDENHIQLDMEPEVSSLDFASGIRLSDLVLPALRVRRAKTVLELRDGQSFALAGLLDNSEQVNLSKVPLLGDIPILGELFKSRRFQRNETELVFLVTVKLVEPLNPDQLPTLPGAADLKRGMTPPPATGIEGQSGHAVKGKSGGEPVPEASTKQPEPAVKQPEQTAKKDQPEVK
jgi:pilus assembly protein CpaC